jgi:hypothetical protein
MSLCKSLPLKKTKPSGQNVVTSFMDHNIYLLATDPKNACRDVIHSRDTGLKVRVFCLEDEQFTPEDEEIQLYGYADKKLYAFETINIAAEDALDVVSAIQWYAEYIGFPKMEILPEDPRGAGENQETIVKGLDLQ